MSRQPLLVCWFAFGLAVLPSRTLLAETSMTARHVRTLMMVQDQIVLGSRAALESIGELRRRLAAEIAQAPDSSWKDPQEGRALVVHLLNGGAPHPIRALVAKNVDLGEWRDVVVALLAFAERQKDAVERLTRIDARTLDPGIAGHFALIQAIASAGAPEQAKAYIGLAKLLSPGGVVEEGATRRELEQFIAAGKKLEAGQVAARYLWRFGSSLYAKDVVLYLAASVIPELAAAHDGRVVVGSLVNELPQKARVETLLPVARNAVVLGKMEVAAFAASTVQAYATPGSDEQSSAGLYAEIAEAFLRPSDAAARKLKARVGRSASAEDTALVDVTVLVLEQLRAPLRAQPASHVAKSAAIEATERTIETASVALIQDQL